MKVKVQLPIPRDAEIVVDIGDKISQNSVIAQIPLLNTEKIIHLSRLLKIPPQDIQKYLEVRVGVKIHLGEIIAQKKSFLKTSFIRSPVEGKIKEIDFKKGIMLIDNAKDDESRSKIKSPVSGKITKINSYDLELELDGDVYDIVDGEGEDILGELVSFDKIVDLFDLSSETSNKIILSDEITESALTKAEVVGVKGLILNRRISSTNISWISVAADVFKKIFNSTGQKVWLRISLKQLVILD